MRQKFINFLILGADGQLGTEFVNLVKSIGTNSACLTKSDLDVRDHAAVWRMITGINPEVIINCTAVHNVVWCEKNPQETFDVNTHAVRNLAEVASQVEATLVHFSSNYVFGQEKRDTPYVEDNRTGPVNIYGVSKVAGEDFVRYSHPAHYIIRTSTLFGTNKPIEKKNNFIDLMLKLGKEKGEVKVVDDQTTNPTYVKDLAEKTMELIETKKYGTYHMVGDGSCSYHTFAQRIFVEAKMDVKCEPVDSSFFESNKYRPFYTALSNKKIKDLGIRMPGWKDMLVRYLSEKAEKSKISKK